MKIKSIHLHCKNLEAQKDFYTNQLDFDLLESSTKKFSIQTGITKITFEKNLNHNYYHFAFNIPSFQIQEAFDWLKSKAVEFISYEGSYFIDFKDWNADALYFYDADGNIAELIARKNMAIKSDEKFSKKSILGVSEIGMPVMDVGVTRQRIIDELNLNQYSGDQHYFCAMGDEEGLIIIVDQKVKKWFPTTMPAISAPFRMNVEIEGKEFDFKYSATSSAP